MTAHLKKEQVELPSLSLKKGRLLILECLMLTACLRILLTVSACTGLFAEIDRSKERKGSHARLEEALRRREGRVEVSCTSERKKEEAELSDSAVDEHDVQTLSSIPPPPHCISVSASTNRMLMSQKEAREEAALLRLV